MVVSQTLEAKQVNFDETDKKRSPFEIWCKKVFDPFRASRPAFSPPQAHSRCLPVETIMRWRPSLGQLLEARKGVSVILSRLHALFRSYGLRVFVRKKMPYGIDPWNDVARLSRSRPIQIAFDVGAHVGETARALVRYFPQARIFSFEPLPATFDALKRNIKGLSRVGAYNIAFGAKEEIRKMYIYAGPSTINSFVPDAPFAVTFPKPATTCEIEVITIDSFAQQNCIERIDLLKVDTEGFDIQVLRGAQALFERRAIRFVYSEFNEITRSSESTGGVFLELYEFMTTYDFRLVAIYTDYIKPHKNFFSVRNALFAGNTSDWQRQT